MSNRRQLAIGRLRVCWRRACGRRYEARWDTQRFCSARCWRLHRPEDLLADAPRQLSHTRIHTYGPRAKSRPDQRGRSMATIRCTNCGQLGHNRRTCGRQ